MSTDRLRYVYAVTRPFDGVLPEGAHGIDGEPPHLLRHGDLVAVTGAVPAGEFDEAPLRARLEDLDWLAATARAHDAVVAALSTVTCPLPLRLATVCRDDSGVRRLLEDGHDRFVRALARLDGRVEWGVKVYAEPGAAEEAEPAAPEPGASGRDYLRRRLNARRSREGDWQRADALSRRLHGELSRHAEAGTVHRPQDTRLSNAPGVNVLNAAYLVDRARSPEFVQLVEAVSEPGVRVELTGPWAPYSFAGIADEAPREAAR
ncbi:GvpL/GvpF family gas vesicle protein [Streptomyces ficellus]|uniref:GvpL/GvpF family gas vesicle protein n=1 Tax=Streptomyces ficellus TaxID=1977088 RepID=A0A6I6FN05_9ACTN|nr:GvpL/GvpF family gas vesicle protein [Streptomyces ficellus]QGV77716.1 GvpL/GvpF family gas vesicle protein [Streptomyces ficellus]